MNKEDVSVGMWVQARYLAHCPDSIVLRYQKKGEASFGGVSNVDSAIPNDDCFLILVDPTTERDGVLQSHTCHGFTELQ